MRSAGSGESGNGQRSGWFTEATNRPPGRSTRATSASAPRASATNGSPPKAEHARSTLSVASGRAPTSACSSAGASPVTAASSRGPGQHPRRQVERHHLGAGGGQPPGARRRAAADLQHPPARDVAEQPRVGLAQPLGPPQEVRVAQVGTVLGEVGRRRGVPPAAVGPHRLGLGHRAALHPAGQRVAVARPGGAERASGDGGTAAGRGGEAVVDPPRRGTYHGTSARGLWCRRPPGRPAHLSREPHPGHRGRGASLSLHTPRPEHSTT